MPDTLAQLEEILYEGLIGLEDPRDREDFLEQACHGNPALRDRLVKLLELRDEAEKFFGMESGPPPIVPDADADLTEGLGTHIGRYRLLERLGEGGHGVVYQAEQLEPVRRRVALKIIRVGMDTAHIIERFEMERQALALMDHPNIARVLDAGATASGRPFFVMEMVKGMRITAFCDENRLDLPARLRLFITVCLAIQHAHQKGVIHCDIKPSNILVTLHDGVAVPKVIDFGIAKATESGHPDFSSATAAPFIGTPAYMSPEQVNDGGMDVDTRSDIHSLGVVLHELLAGLPPRDPEFFRQAGAEEIRGKLNEPVPLPSERLAACPPDTLRTLAEKRHLAPARMVRVMRGDLDAIVGKAMEIDRQRRYATASGLAADLSRYLGHELVSARPAGKADRLLKLVRRNRIAFASGTIVVAALGAGFGISTWLFIRENHARQEQARLRQAAETSRASEIRLREKALAGERVAHAAVLVSHGDIAQADRVLAKVEPDLVPASLESATTFQAVGDWLLHEGRWEDASKRLTTMAQAISRVDKSQSESISIRFVAAGAAVTDAGDMELYERLRRMAADRFSSATDPFIVDQTVKSCLITPADPALMLKLEPLIRLLERNVPWDRIDRPEESMEAWQIFTLALAAHRKGEAQLAAHWASRCLRHPSGNASRAAAASAILAMACHHTGQADDARSQLERAKNAIDANFNGPFQMGTPWDGFWFDWTIARTLLKEADGVVDSAG